MEIEKNKIRNTGMNILQQETLGNSHVIWYDVDVVTAPVANQEYQRTMEKILVMCVMETTVPV